MTVHVKLFATLRDQANTAELTLDLPQGATVADAARLLQQRLKSPDALRSAAFAVNLEYAAVSTVLKENDELAVIPPVSGG